MEIHSVKNLHNLLDETCRERQNSHFNQRDILIIVLFCKYVYERTYYFDCLCICALFMNNVLTSPHLAYSIDLFSSIVKITLESLAETNQYWAMMVKYFLLENLRI